MDFYQQRKQGLESSSHSIDLWISWVRHRLRFQNKNYIIVVCGETGSGKSWLALKLMELLDDAPSFDKVSFSAEDFVRYANVHSRPFDVLLWDEAGIKDEGAMSRDWHQNKEIVSVFEIMRFKNFCLIMTVPSLSYIDKGLRDLVHLFIEVKRVDKKKGVTYAEPRQLQHNPLNGVTYKKFPRFTDGSKTFKIKQMQLKRPSEALTVPYEKAQAEFKSRKMKDYYEQIVKAKEDRGKDWSKPIDVSDMVDAVCREPLKYSLNGKLNCSIIAAEMGVGRGTASKVYNLSKKRLE